MHWRRSYWRPPRARTRKARTYASSTAGTAWVGGHRQPWNARSKTSSKGWASPRSRQPLDLGIAEALYLRTERGVSVYDISSPDDPQEIHAMTDPGWFENTARSRNLLVRHDSESQMVEVYEVAARCTI